MLDRDRIVRESMERVRMRVLIWGAGRRTKKFIEKQYFDNNCEINAIIDSKKNGSTYYGYKVFHPKSVPNIINDIDYIVICNRFYHDIIEECVKMGVSLDKLIITDNCLDSPFCYLYEKNKELFPQIYEDTKHLTQRTTRLNEKDIVDTHSFYYDDRFTDIEYRMDYFRYRTFEFVAEEIKRRNIEGAIAELGVFKGLFSAVINYTFPNRNLYLFDTFEGFNSDEARKEVSMGRCTEYFIDAHKNTSVEIMMANLVDTKNVFVCKGFFPESVTEKARNEKYAFVSLDVDFEDSTLEGLRFFYPRLVEGGYIFVHDYNTYFLDGIRRAIERFEKETNERIKEVPIADRAGTIIIAK